MKKNKKLLAVLLAAALMLGSCGNSNTGGAVSNSQTNSLQESSQPSGVSESGETVSGSAGEDAQDGENRLQEASLPDDGKIRILSDWEGNRSIVFCGNKTVYDGEGSAFTPLNGDAEPYFAVRTIDPEANDGAGAYQTALYDADGKKLVDGLGDMLTICGNWLFSGDDGFAASDTDGMQPKVYDLTTMKEKEGFSADGYVNQSGEYLALNGYGDPNVCTVCRADDLSVIREFENESATVDINIPGMFLMSHYDMDSGTSQQFVYDPATGKEYDNVYEVCGKNLILQAGEGDTAYQVVNLSTGEVVEETDRHYTIYTDAVKVWRNSENSDATFYIDAPCYSAPQAVRYVNQLDYSLCIGESGYFINSDSGNSGKGELISVDGEMLLSVNPSDYGYDSGNISEINGNLLVISPADWNTPGVTLIYQSGHTVDLPKYTSISPLYGSEYLSASYTVGNTYLYDILDQDGKVLLEGLKSVTTVEGGLLQCEKGFDTGIMDINGNWLYKESIFNSTEDDAGEDW